MTCDVFYSLLFVGSTFVWYRDVFFVVSSWPTSPFWHRDLFFGIEIMHSVVEHLDRLLPGINLCVPFGPPHPVNGGQ